MTRNTTNSMTGFASLSGAHDVWRWQWEIRGVNGRGLDLRFRLPEGFPGLEQSLRTTLQKALSRGSVTVSLKLAKDAGSETRQLNFSALDQALNALSRVEEAASSRQLVLSQTSAADILALPDVFSAAEENEDREVLAKALVQDFSELVSRFKAARAQEGKSLDEVLSRQLSQIEDLTNAAQNRIVPRAQDRESAFRQALTRVVETEDVDEGRVAQELALLAVKADITEEIDRLRAHVEAGKTLLSGPGPKGRKLDFLSQEFNREANTLCSKSGDQELTAIGLELKTVIDQMREQVQNVE